jgi:CRISPR system Cascade subunit CasB
MTEATQTDRTTEPTRKIDRGAVAAAWWAHLRPHPSEPDKPASPGNRAAIARLKRAPISAAMAEPAVAQLYGRLEYQAASVERMLPRVAVLAIVLAHVKTDEARQLARIVGVPRGKQPEDAALKPLRLRRLLAARGDDDILIAFRRAVAIGGAAANVADLAHLVLGWDRDEQGERLRARFAFDYYDAAASAPQTALREHAR